MNIMMCASTLQQNFVRQHDRLDHDAGVMSRFAEIQMKLPSASASVAACYALSDTGVSGDNGSLCS